MIKVLERILDIPYSKHGFKDSEKILEENNIHEIIQGMVYRDELNIKIY